MVRIPMFSRCNLFVQVLFWHFDWFLALKHSYKHQFENIYYVCVGSFEDEESHQLAIPTERTIFKLTVKSVPLNMNTKIFVFSLGRRIPLLPLWSFCGGDSGRWRCGYSPQEFPRRRTTKCFGACQVPRSTFNLAGVGEEKGGIYLNNLGKEYLYIFKYVYIYIYISTFFWSKLCTYHYGILPLVYDHE